MVAYSEELLVVVCNLEGHHIPCSEGKRPEGKVAKVSHSEHHAYEKAPLQNSRTLSPRQLLGMVCVITGTWQLS